MIPRREQARPGKNGCGGMVPVYCANCGKQIKVKQKCRQHVTRCNRCKTR